MKQTRDTFSIGPYYPAKKMVIELNVQASIMLTSNSQVGDGQIVSSCSHCCNSYGNRRSLGKNLPNGEVMADQNDVDLDSIIDRLLEVRGSRPGKQVQLLEAEIRYLCTKAREIFISQPILLELEAPIKVCSVAIHIVRNLRHAC